MVSSDRNNNIDSHDNNNKKNLMSTLIPKPDFFQVH